MLPNENDVPREMVSRYITRSLTGWVKLVGWKVKPRGRAVLKTPCGRHFSAD